MFSKCFTTTFTNIKSHFILKFTVKWPQKLNVACFNHENQTKPHIENVHTVYILCDDDYIVKEASGHIKMFVEHFCLHF